MRPKDPNRRCTDIVVKLHGHDYGLCPMHEYAKEALNDWQLILIKAGLRTPLGKEEGLLVTPSELARFKRAYPGFVFRTLDGEPV